MSFLLFSILSICQSASVDRKANGESSRVDCQPEPNKYEKECTDRGCIWEPAETAGAPWCYYPTAYPTYNLVNQYDTTMRMGPAGIKEVAVRVYEIDLDNNAYSLPEYKNQLPELDVRVYFLDNTSVRVKFINRNSPDRFEVPVIINDPIETASEFDKDGNVAMKYTIDIVPSPFSIQITRREDSQIIFDTSIGPLIFYDQFLQITTTRPSEFVYGFGETEHLSLKYDMNWKTQGMWARDNGVGTDVNLYGVQPYHLTLERSGKSSGVLLLNANAQEVATSPYPHITYRTIGGILDFFVFTGPTPEDVTRQYTQYLGRSYLFPYWSLGFQLCRYGYQSLDEIKTVVDENRAYGIPYDVQYADIDYMERQLDFTLDERNFAGLADYVDKIRSEYDMRFILILDPAISADEGSDPENAWRDYNGEVYPTYQRGLDSDVYIRGSDGELEYGKVWPYLPGVYLDDIVQDDNGWDANVAKYHSKVTFPDYFRNETSVWWTDEIERLHHDMFANHTGILFDGIWVDMNEPASFVAGRPTPTGENAGLNGCPNDKYNRPPYIPRSLQEGRNRDEVSLFEKTICMDSIQTNPLTGLDEKHYNMHSLYGYSEGQPTLDACESATNARCIVFSRSTFPGAQKTIGHWLGDNTSKWQHVKQSVIGAIEFSLFGFSYTGPDTCGFFNEADEEMCMRWTQIGAFFTFSRNHNGLANRRQDPASWGSKFAGAARKVLEQRYRMLPYLYTLMYRAHKFGDSVTRALFMNFPEDDQTWSIDEQMMWGDGLLITPVLNPGRTTVDGYFPDARWYNYYTGTEVVGYGMQELYAEWDILNLHLKGGRIIPIQKPATTTMESRINGLGLLISLDTDYAASGELYWDEGDSIGPLKTGRYTLVDFNFVHNQLRSEVKMSEISHEYHKNKDESFPLRFTHMEINGLSGYVSDIIINGVTLEPKYWQQNRNGRIEILETQLNDGSYSVDLPIGQQFDIMFNVNSEAARADCAPNGSDEASCTAKGCKWTMSETPGVPWCIYGSSYPQINFGYRMPSEDRTPKIMTENDVDLTLELPAENANAASYSRAITNPALTMRKISKNVFRMKLTDSDNENRYEIPDEAEIYQSPNEGCDCDVTADDYQVEYGESNDRFYFSLSRKGKMLIDSRHGPVIFEDQFLEISFNLGSYNCYGMGEQNHRRFRHLLNWQRWAMFSRDVAPIDEWNFYGTQPFVMCVDDDSAFGIYYHNSNAQEGQFSPAPAFTWRSVGGVFDVTIIVADTPEEVVQHYTTSVIGRPFLPPLWALGFQLSRWGYNSLEKMESVVNEMLEAKIPYDAQYGDIDYMDRKRDFTYDPVAFEGFPEFVQNLQETNKMHYIVILDPAIQNSLTPNGELLTQEEYEAFYTGNEAMNHNGEKGIWVRDAEGNPVQAEVWPGPTYFPDFTDVEYTGNWWTEECSKFYNETGVHYNALWIDMNEPANFQTDSGALTCYGPLNYPPFVPNILDGDKGLYVKTICMDSVQKWGLHYDVHSLYGHAMSLVTDKTLKKLFPGKRSFALTRSQFAGTGRHAGHWLGDNQSFWSNMGWSIVGMMEYSLFGFSYTGADICGFWFNTTETMCQRWSQLGAFYPYSRNHNGIDWRDQHPPALGPNVVESARKTLLIRYQLLPTLYTLMFESHWSGSTTVRSLMAEFPADRNARDVYDQFLWGKGFMIAPIMEEYATERGVYFPPDTWYGYDSNGGFEKYSNLQIDGGKTKLIHADMNTIPLFVRAGTMLVTQEPDLTTTDQRTHPMTLNIYFAGPDAHGSLFWDDGESELFQDLTLKENILMMDYKMTSTEITATCRVPEGILVNEDCYFQLKEEHNNVLEMIRIIGVESSIIATIGGTVLDVERKTDIVHEIRLNNVQINDQWTINISLN